MREEKLLGLRRFIGRREKFWKIFGGFYGIFYNFFGKFLQFFLEFSAIFLENFPKNFRNFFNFCDFPTIFPENFRPQSVTVQPGSRHYCKLTIKFTIRFTPILIKILQSTKFEGSHFHNLSQLLIHFFNSLKPFQTLLPAFPSLRSFPFAAVFSRP